MAARESGVPATRQFLTMSNADKLTNEKEPSCTSPAGSPKQKPVVYKYRAVDVLVGKNSAEQNAASQDNVVDILLQLIRRTDPRIPVQRFH
jgi:hypothetical protein